MGGGSLSVWGASASPSRLNPGYDSKNCTFISKYTTSTSCRLDVLAYSMYSEPSAVCILLSYQVMLHDEVVIYCWSKYDLQFIVHVLLTLFGACASDRNTLLVYFIGYLVAAYIDKRYMHTWTTADMYLYSMQIPSLHNHAYIQNEMPVTA